MKAILFSIFFLTLSFSKSLFSESDSLSQLKKQMAASTDAASDSGEDLMAIDYLQGKLLAPVDASGNPRLDASGKQILPAWYPHFYPSAEEMSPTSTAKPKLRVFQGLSASDSKLVPEWEVFREDKLGNCVRLNGSILLYSSKNSAPTACLNYVKSYQLDLGGLSGIQLLNSSGQLATDPEENGFQSGFIGVVDMKQLTQAQKDQMFSTPSAVPPKSVGAINPKKVIFRKYVADENNSQKLAAIEVQVGNTLARVPIISENFPPQPKCEIRLSSGTGSSLEPGSSINLDLFADSILTQAAMSANNFLTTQQLTLPNQQAVSSIGTLTKVGTQTYVVPTNPYPGTSANQTGGLINWQIGGSVFGVDSAIGSIQCQPLIVTVRKDLPPVCSMTASPLNLVRGQTTNITFQSQNKVNSVTIDGKPITLNSSGGAVVPYVRKTNDVTETVLANISGPGGQSQCEIPLGRTCPFNDTNYVGQLMSAQAFQSFLNENDLSGGIKIADANSNTEKTFYRDAQGVFAIPANWLSRIDTSYSVKFSKSGKVFKASPGSSSSRLFWMGIFDGNEWKVDWNECDNPSLNNVICLRTREVATTSANNWEKINASYEDDPTNTIHSFWGKKGGDEYDFKIGPADQSSCNVQRAFFRTSGCFASSTEIAMADGSQRKISDIMEGDLVLNPHYQTGVRVRKVVKGPEKKSLYEVQIGKNKVEVTEDHPFLTQRGWVQAMDLKAGDKLFGEGQGKVVAQSRKLPYKGPEDVWNFELDTEDPLARVVVANGVPTGELSTQLELKKVKKLVP